MEKPLFCVGFVVSCCGKSGSYGVFYVVSCQVSVCDASGIGIHCLKTAEHHKFCCNLSAMAWTEQIRRVGVSCWVCGPAGAQ